MSRRSGLPWKGILAAIVLVVGLIMVGMTADSNDAGYRTVVQYPNGKLWVKFDAGWYLKWFGTTTIYPDVITYDFDRSENGEGATIDQKGIPVLFRDGGTGTVYGIVQTMLPTTEVDMLKLHKIYRTPNGVAHKVIKKSVDEAANLTAGLFTSEAAYDVKRAIFTEWMDVQLKKGKYKTAQETITETDEVTGKIVKKEIPVRYLEGGVTPVHLSSDFQEVGITVIGSVKLDKSDFEPRTMEQIAEKRKATMAIITAKANAERAKQDTITAEEQGKAKVMEARYAMMIEKEKAVVDAERVKEVAVIKASQNVDVAEQRKLEAEQMKLRATEIKQEQILLGEGEAERKRLVMEADGALEKKLQAWENATIAGYKYLGQQDWVPSTYMGGGGNSGVSTNGGNNIVEFMDILKVKAAKDLSLDMSMKGTAAQ
jgi:hypothetical protein